MFFITRSKGSIFILTIWVLLVLSIFALCVGRMVHQRIGVVKHLETRQRLRDIADAGIKTAVHIINSKKKEPPIFDALNQDWSTNEEEFRSISVGEGTFTVSYPAKDTSTSYGAVDEERKINLNLIDSPIVLTRLFQYGAGLTEERSRSMAVSILDWRDEDDNPHDVGAETSYYETLHPPYAAKNKDISTLEELLWIKGITADIYRKMLPYVTLDGSRRVNINTASAVVLHALGLSDTLIYKIDSFRRGPDSLWGTKDDRVFNDVTAVAADLGKVYALGPDEQKSFGDFLQSDIFRVNSENFLIRSVAQIPNRTDELTVVCVVERYGKIKRWHEFY